MPAVWYEQEKIRDELMLFGRAIQGVAPYEIVIEPDPVKCHSACCSFNLQRITVNPTLFKAEDTEQYNLTKALLVHEAGHKRHTTPTTLPVNIREIANILEDERVERRMWEEFAGLQWLIYKLAERFYEESETINPDSDVPSEVISYFLQLRWAKRIDKTIKGGLSVRNKTLWEKVEPFVYQSWQAENSMVVYRNAARIAEILGIQVANTNNK
jgi:hypothetical protein